MLVMPCDPRPKLKTYGEKCFQLAGPKEWHNLSSLIRESPSIYRVCKKKKDILNIHIKSERNNIFSQKFG